MLTKTWTFEELPTVDSIELDLLYNYEYTPAKLDGLPENCYPEEEECEVVPPDDYKTIIREAYAKAAELAISEIETTIKALQDDKLPAEWIEEECDGDY